MMSSLGAEMVTIDTGKPKVEAPKYLRIIRFGGLAIKNVYLSRPGHTLMITDIRYSDSPMQGLSQKVSKTNSRNIGSTYCILYCSGEHSPHTSHAQHTRTDTN